MIHTQLEFWRGFCNKKKIEYVSSHQNPRALLSLHVYILWHPPGSRYPVCVSQYWLLSSLALHSLKSQQFILGFKRMQTDLNIFGFIKSVRIFIIYRYLSIFQYFTGRIQSFPNSHSLHLSIWVSILDIWQVFK